MDQRKNKLKPKAFTMIELMAILIILGLLATITAREVGKAIERAKLTTTKTNLKLLHGAVQDFYMDTGRYPAEDEGLMVLVDPPADLPNVDPGGYLETTELPQDGWRNDFDYRLDPGTGKAFEIISYGSDGEESEDDLSSTDAF